MSGPAERIAVDVLTGFLGAGKTTLIRRLLERGRLRDTAILVNEFASVPVDQRLIALSGGTAGVIGEGCLCCVVDGSVRDALLDLAEQRAAGRLPAFTRVLIETSGLADPAGLVATLALDRRLKPRFQAGRVVTLVDLAQGEAAIGDTAEALSQIVCADTVLLTRSARSGDDRSEAIAARIAALNPLAAIHPDDGAIDPFDAALPPPRPAEMRRFASIAVEGRHGAVRSGVLRLDGPVAWPAFAAWLSLLAHRHGDRLLRLKGTLRLAEGGPPVLVQSVRHIVHRPEHLTDAAAADGLEIVVILRDLDPALLQRSLAAFVPVAASPARAAAG